LEAVIKTESHLDRFYQLWQQLQYELTEVGISKGPLRLPAKLQESVLDRAMQQLQEFSESEALILFRAARDLRPPGVLKLWSEDELTRSARETKLYVSARRLLRDEWGKHKTLKRLIMRVYRDEN
jgi:hypothetical protein